MTGAQGMDRMRPHSWEVQKAVPIPQATGEKAPDEPPQWEEKPSRVPPKAPETPDNIQSQGAAQATITLFKWPKSTAKARFTAKIARFQKTADNSLD